MKIFENVKSSQKDIPSTEVNVDTVYTRNNITPFVDDDFQGSNIGREVQQPINKYIETIGELGQMLAESELQNLILGQQVTELELMILMGGQ